jgi:hypothetical protein
MTLMENDDSREYRWPLQAWADVDPALHPFDPAGALTVVRSVATPLPPPVPPSVALNVWGGPGSEYRAARDVAFRWNVAMTDALVAHYGSWAQGWHWTPDAGDYSGERVRRWEFFEPISTSAAEALPLVADELVRWRRWLESLAERFDRFWPALRPGGPDRGDVASWEAAIAHLLTASAAGAEDEGSWQGWSRNVLIWFLTAAGLPELRSVMLVHEGLDSRYDHWKVLSPADVADIAERIARQAAGPADDHIPGPGQTSRPGQIPRPGQGADDWPDTWPQGWPSWRATNLPRSHS